MKTPAWLTYILSMLLYLSPAMLSGCGLSFEAESARLVEPAAMPGRIALKVANQEKLLRDGRIAQAGNIVGADGVSIGYWLIRGRAAAGPTAAATSAPARVRRGSVILLHPLLASKSWFLSLGEELAGEGWDVVLPDNRGHGNSGGEHVTWGFKEKQDIKLLMDTLLKAKAVSEPLYVLGASQGGCTAIQYAAYDPRCRGVVALCPPASARHAARRMLPWLNETDLGARLKFAGELAGFNPDEASALEAAKRLRCPLILIHGTMDFVVPYQDSEAIFQAAAGPKRMISMPWRNHFTVQVGQDKFLAQKLAELELSARRQQQRRAPAAAAPTPAPSPARPAAPAATPAPVTPMPAPPAASAPARAMPSPAKPDALEPPPQRPAPKQKFD